ncbi:MAG: asparagine synthase (glutamine-hydrolyzing) [Solirubrobacterales bacterium]
MCGIAGIVRPREGQPVTEAALLRMARAIRHRGPDGYGLALDAGAGLVSTRLAIVDLPCGWQPLDSGQRGDLLVYNGEVYNHIELREELRAAGESFSTTSDTEVVQRLLQREGHRALDRFNGQFALAWWQPDRRRLTLVRDRFGVRPLHYALLGDGSLVFGSEAKALFASGEVSARPDLAGLDEVFTLWGARPRRTAFLGVDQLPPGGLLVWERGRIVEQRRWWEPDYGASDPPSADLRELLGDSVSLRLRADVPVGAYLSGGLDSSLISALAQIEKQGELRTFSIAFKDPQYDERAHQEAVARALGTSHHVVEAGPGEIARALPAVLRHTETPLVRTAPVPLYLLAEQVRAHDLTVVITGEGADELFWGYDLFKEVVVRELSRTEPERAKAMLEEFYPYLGGGGARRGPAFTRFLLETGSPDDPLGSHLTRAEATATVKAFYRPEVAEEIGEGASLGRLRDDLPAEFGDLSTLERAAWLEVATLLEPYLLAAQGDRVAMAHGVEGRFPFLDDRVFDYSTELPAERKLEGMRDKVALRDVAADLLPEEIVARPKQPYRAPEVVPFFGSEAPEWVEEAMSPAALAETGIWDAGRVAGLLQRCRAGRATGIREGMALVGILSTQLWHEEFCGAGAGAYPAETAEPHVRIDRSAPSKAGEAA